MPDTLDEYRLFENAVNPYLTPAPAGGASAIGAMPEWADAFARYQGIPVGTYTPRVDEVLQMIMYNPNMSDAEKVTTIKGLQSNLGLSDEQFDYILKLAGAALPSNTSGTGDTGGAGVTPGQNGTPASTIRDLINKGAVNAGKVWDKVTGTFSKIFQLPDLPDATVFNPFDPSATVTWGKTGGSSSTGAIPVGKTPGGTDVAATTGIPALDKVLAKVIDIIKGKAGVGDLIPTEEEIKVIFADVIREQYGLPEGKTVDEVLAEAGAAASKAWERRQRLGKGDGGDGGGFG